MKIRIERLDVKKDSIGRIKQTDNMRIIAPERPRRRIKAGIDSSIVSSLEELGGKMRLQHRFTAGEGNAALITPVVAIAQSLYKHFLSEHLHRRRTRPRIRIVTVDAAETAAVKEHNEPHAGAIRRAERFERMYPARHRLLWQVRLMTSSCCSRERSMNLTAYPLTRIVKLAYSGFSGCSIASTSFSVPNTFTFRWCAPRVK